MTAENVFVARAPSAARMRSAPRFSGRPDQFCMASVANASKSRQAVISSWCSLAMYSRTCASMSAGIGLVDEVAAGLQLRSDRGHRGGIVAAEGLVVEGPAEQRSAPGGDVEMAEEDLRADDQPEVALRG